MKQLQNILNGLIYHLSIVIHENPKVDKLRKFSTISRTLGYTIKCSLEVIRSKELSKSGLKQVKEQMNMSLFLHYFFVAWQRQDMMNNV